MRIDVVRATAFGPFRGESLSFSPGLNVVHGPNEAGKSSWFAATYAGLAGRRRARGRGTLAQAMFANRHKPWSGSQWKVGVTVTLDDGTVLAFEHDLRSGDTTVMDARRRAVRLTDLQRQLGIDLSTESTVDGTRLLGLNRDSARATIFTGQADILRVTTEADALQDLLERSATTEAVDATADGALAWLDEQSKEWVGSPSVGNRPLRARRRARDEARQVAGNRRDELGRLTETIVESRRVEEQLTAARQELDRLDDMERWRDIRSLQGRIGKIEVLRGQLNQVGAAKESVDEDQLRVAAEVLGAFERGSDVAPLPEGPTARDLQAAIDLLPEMPVGDLAPRPEVEVAQTELARSQTALATHLSSAPALGPPVQPLPLSADQLRSLADVLDATPSAVDEALTRELALLEQADDSLRRTFAEAQVAYEATLERNDAKLRAHAEAVDQQARAAANAVAVSRGVGPVLIIGALVCLVGVVVAVTGMPIPGVAAVLVGISLVVYGLRGRGASPFVPPVVISPPQLEEPRAPLPPPTDPRIMELRVEIRSQQRAEQDHHERVDRARSTVLAHSLEPDPAALRDLARAIDDAAGVQQRVRTYSERAAVLRGERDNAARQLAALLGEDVGGRVDDAAVDNLQRAFDEYVAACRHRSVTASNASRRPDLLEALAQRRSLEAAHAAALLERRSQEEAVKNLATSIGLDPAHSASSAAAGARHWLDQQASAREVQVQRRELSAGLDQLLDGRDLVEWQADLAALVEGAGPEPDAIPDDVETRRADAASRFERLSNRVGQLAGERRTISQSLGSVAEALEQEADAERAVSQVESLKSYLDAAIAELTAAKERAQADIAPALEAKLRPWLPRITSGRYLDVKVDASDLSMDVTDSTGSVRQAELLSHGTTEQLYLLLRLSLGQVLSGSGETPPLVLDDVTTQSDQTRTLAVMELLREVSTQHQVILFTQEHEVVTWAEQRLAHARDRLIALPAVG